MGCSQSAAVQDATSPPPQVQLVPDSCSSARASAPVGGSRSLPLPTPCAGSQSVAKARSSESSPSLLAYLSQTSHAVSSASASAPMWACRNAVVQELGEIEVHEELLAEHKIVNLDLVDEDCRMCVFVSQSWASFSHPDPAGVKLRLLRKLLEAMESGRVEFPRSHEEQLFHGYSCLPREQAQEAVRGGHVWFDYWSVPQRDAEQQQVYISAIPRFVQMCSLFIALVPPCEHLDTGEVVDKRTWEGRGWCRLELTANVLAKSPPPYLIVESPGCCYMGSPKHWLLNSVGMGKFSCCTLNHTLPCGKRICCDKTRIIEVLQNLLDRKVETAGEANDLFTMRLLMSLRGHLLRGLGVPPEADDSSVDRWLEQFRFSSPLDRARSGWSPLRYAVYAGRLDIAERLLDARADVESPLQKSHHDLFFHHKKLTVLHGIALIRDDPEAVKFLVARKADPSKRFEGGFSALFACAIGATQDNFGALLDLGCKAGGFDAFGSSLLSVLCIHGSPELLSIVSKRCPEMLEEFREDRADGHGYLAYSIAMGHHGAEMARAVLDLRVGELEFKNSPRQLPMKALIAVSRLRCYLRETDPRRVEMTMMNLYRATPLLIAAAAGNMPVLKLLLERRADPMARNRSGRSALILAAMFDHPSICDLLLSLGVPKETKDSWGRNASDWAVRGGDLELAERLRPT